MWVFKVLGFWGFRAFVFFGFRVEGFRVLGLRVDLGLYLPDSLVVTTP